MGFGGYDYKREEEKESVKKEEEKRVEKREGRGSIEEGGERECR